MGEFLLLISGTTFVFLVIFWVGWTAAHNHIQKPAKRPFRYVGVIHKSLDTYRLTFPDFPELVTVADALAPLYHNAEIVLGFHLETLLEEGCQLPKATTPQVCFFLLEDLPEALGFWVIRVEI